MTAFHCPICQAPLQPNPQGFGCQQRHQFDKAKEGYVNLLPVQHKKSKNPGDDAQMVQARRAFLAAGHYQFLQQSLIDTIAQLVAGLFNETAEEETATKTESKPITTIADSGCGEGYYTNGLADRLCQNHQLQATCVYGIDIAKTAIRYAAKRGPNTHYAVASSHALPFAANNIDILFKVFAPMADNEIKRVLNPAGYFISVVPGPMHLQQLREKIYEQVTPHQPEQCPAGFRLKSTINRQQQVTLTQSDDIQHLCKMTPFAWKLSKQVQNELFSAESLTVDFDFTINVYQIG